MQPLEPHIPKQFHPAINSIAKMKHVTIDQVVSEAMESYLLKHNLDYGDDNKTISQMYALSDSLEEIWDNPEDEIYDKLYGEQS